MAAVNMTIKVKQAWWLKPYFIGLAAMSALTGLDPDWEKVKRVIDKGLSVKVSESL